MKNVGQKKPPAHLPAKAKAAPPAEPVSLDRLRQDATSAQDKGDLQEMLRLWEAFRMAAPERPEGYVAALRGLRSFRRLDLTGDLLTEALSVFPDNVDLLVIAARRAETMKRADEADEYWQQVTQARPNSEEFSLAAAMALSCQKNGLMKRMPTVLARLDEHHARFPDHVAAYTAHVGAFRLMRAFLRGNRLAAKWCREFPDEVPLALARIALIEDQDNAESALSELTALRDRAAPNPEIEVAHLRILSCSGDAEAAEQAYEEARVLFPLDRKLLIEYSRFASRTGDWHEVERRLVAAQAILPDDKQVARELKTARQQLLGLAGSDADENGTAADGAAQRADEAAAPQSLPAEAGLMSRFESLGGPVMGCEFGMVQRQFGSENVGLLRWTNIYPKEMIEALESEFEGVGLEENTELRTVRHGAGHEEYSTRDTRFKMSSHTFVRTSDAPADRMLQQTCRRLRFLRNKLIEVLQSGEQIFVYRSQNPIADQTVLAMQAGLARYGENALVCVKRADEDHRGGTLRVLAHGAFVGYVSHFRNDRDIATGSDLEGWLSVCRQADVAWQAARMARRAA